MFVPVKPVIAVVGTKDSGKTMAVEVLVQGLSSKGCRVATVKHIPKLDFTIDREGTDTWRYARAGAKVVVSVAPSELTVIKRFDTRDYDLTQIVTECGEDIDLIVLEGFKSLVEKVPHVLKIVAAKSIDEAHEASKRFSPVLAYVGLASTEKFQSSFSYINVLEEKEKLVDLVHEKLEAVRSASKQFKGIKILIDGRDVPCRHFVQEIIRKTVLAMISTLKGADIKGDEEVYITVKQAK